MKEKYDITYGIYYNKKKKRDLKKERKNKNKNDINELIYKTDSQISKTNLWLLKGKCGGRDKLRAWE